MPGDEIVNVNGSRLRGLPMPEAKRILRNCCLNNNVTMDIVIARSSLSAATNECNGNVPSVETLEQPLSLLAHHDEQACMKALWFYRFFS